MYKVVKNIYVFRQGNRWYCVEDITIINVVLYSDGNVDLIMWKGSLLWRNLLYWVFLYAAASENQKAGRTAIREVSMRKGGEIKDTVIGAFVKHGQKEKIT